MSTPRRRDLVIAAAAAVPLFALRSAWAQPAPPVNEQAPPASFGENAPVGGLR